MPRKGRREEAILRVLHEIEAGSPVSHPKRTRSGPPLPEFEARGEVQKNRRRVGHAPHLRRRADNAQSAT